ncbi:N-acetyltransferase [Marinilabiliaceae bacterium JC017]|nr:N-acetyltransferase [Marinilabiliaceae bacterium JC017]
MRDEAWQLMEISFPAEERRSKKQQEEILKKVNYCFQEYVTEAGELQGFIAYWKFSDFIFVEHFAINPKYRNNGLGAMFLSDLMKAYEGKRIILEVELPREEIAKRRVNFYERLGFHLNPYNHWQPAYDGKGDGIPLKIMSYPDLLAIPDFEHYQETLFKKVYDAG